MAEVVVTEEMVEAGRQEMDAWGGFVRGDSLSAAYRAMRVLEPPPAGDATAVMVEATAILTRVKRDLLTLDQCADDILARAAVAKVVAELHMKAPRDE